MLGYFQVVWPLNRQPVPLPKDMSLWPSVDIFVPTYNEDLNVVKKYHLRFAGYRLAERQAEHLDPR